MIWCAALARHLRAGGYRANPDGGRQTRTRERYPGTPLKSSAVQRFRQLSGGASDPSRAVANDAQLICLGHFFDH
jgi:hypothetical protein